MSAVAEALDGVLDGLTRDWRRAAAAAGYALRPQVVATGQTPKDVVWSRNKARLYRYHARPEGRCHRVPLLLVYALINRPYIMDLRPGNSLVEYLVGQGYDVFLLDWGVPGDEDAGLRIDDYVTAYLPRGVKQVQRLAGSPDVSMLGYCMGGTFAAMYAALFPNDGLRNLVLLTAPIDFAEAGLNGAWLNPRHFDVDRLVATYPLVPAALMEMGAKLLKPLQNWVGPYVRLHDRLDDDAFVTGWQAINQWVNDSIPFAGEAYRQWVKDFYQGNKLVKGEVRLAGRPVCLADIRCAALNVYADLDHICPTPQAAPFTGLIGSEDKQELVLHAGHVGVVIGRSASKEFFPRLDAWLGERSS